MSEELKPLDCPFCQSDDVHVMAGRSYRVKCLSCYSAGPFADTPNEAIKVWNTRKTNITDDMVSRAAIAIEKEFLTPNPKGFQSYADLAKAALKAALER